MIYFPYFVSFLINVNNQGKNAYTHRCIYAHAPTQTLSHTHTHFAYYTLLYNGALRSLGIMGEKKLRFGKFSLTTPHDTLMILLTFSNCGQILLTELPICQGVMYVPHPTDGGGNPEELLDSERSAHERSQSGTRVSGSVITDEASR